MNAPGPRSASDVVLALIGLVAGMVALLTLLYYAHGVFETL